MPGKLDQSAEKLIQDIEKWNQDFEKLFADIRKVNYQVSDKDYFKKRSPFKPENEKWIAPLQSLAETQREIEKLKLKDFHRTLLGYCFEVFKLHYKAQMEHQLPKTMQELEKQLKPYAEIVAGIAGMPEYKLPRPSF